MNKLLAVAIALITLAAAAPAQASAGCDRVASLQGDDGRAGTPTEPVRSILRLFAVTGPGMTACLQSGQTFHEIVTVKPSGTAAAPIALTSTDPAAPATITGQIRFTGSHIHIDRVNFGGTAAVGDTYPKTYHLGVDGDDVHIAHADITSPRGICVDVGQIDAYGGVEGVRTHDFQLTDSRVHGCGMRNLADGQLTAKDSGVHGIYLKHTAGARIANDLIYDNADRGIQLWPDADGTVIENSTLDGNGSNINLGSYAPNGFFSENTIVRGNIISNSALRSCDGCNVPPGDTAQVLGNFPAGMGTFGNVVEHNCLYQQDATRNFDGNGFLQRDNVLGNPQFVNRVDFEVGGSSACAGFGADPASAPAVGGDEGGGTDPDTGDVPVVTGTPDEDADDTAATDDAATFGDELGADENDAGEEGEDTEIGDDAEPAVAPKPAARPAAAAQPAPKAAKKHRKARKARKHRKHRRSRAHRSAGKAVLHATGSH